jgi:hypothetical protein
LIRDQIDWPFDAASLIHLALEIALHSSVTNAAGASSLGDPRIQTWHTIK